MGRNEIYILDWQSWAVWNSKLGTVAKVTRLDRDSWRVDDHFGRVSSTFRTNRQAFHYANQLPDPADLLSASQ